MVGEGRPRLREGGELDRDGDRGGGGKRGQRGEGGGGEAVNCGVGRNRDSNWEIKYM